MRRQAQRQHGAVLILVLWITSLLVLMLGAFSLNVRIDRQVAGGVLQQVRAQAAADTVLNYLAAVRQADPETWQTMPGEVFRLPWEALDVRFRVLPETAFVDLNTAPEAVLIDVFSGLELDDAAALAAAVVRRREGDPEAADTLSAQPRPWLSVDELLSLEQGLDQVPGLHQLFTVYARQPWVDERFAAQRLLALLAADDYLQTPETEGPGLGDAMYRVQIELGNGTQRRQLEVSARFIDTGVGYQVLHTNLYNVSFSMD